MKLVLDIAWTARALPRAADRVCGRRRRDRRRLLDHDGGADEGSQDDFMRQLIDALPHITVSDERRQPPPQPAETLSRRPRSTA